MSHVLFALKKYYSELTGEDLDLKVRIMDD
jgi:hypothetical protein